MQSRKLKIFGHDWKVRVVKKHKILKGLDGHTDYQNHTIYIDGKLQETEQRATLLHEFFHVILDYHRLKVDWEEQKISTLETALFSIVHDNKIRF